MNLRKLVAALDPDERQELKILLRQYEVKQTITDEERKMSKFDAIKSVRMRLGISLLDAKHIVEKGD